MFIQFFSINKCSYIQNILFNKYLIVLFAYTRIYLINIINKHYTGIFLDVNENEYNMIYFQKMIEKY